MNAMQGKNVICNVLSIGFYLALTKIKSIFQQ